MDECDLYDMDDVCCTCGHRYGRHMGLSCLDHNGDPWGGQFVKVSAVGKCIHVPRKPTPAIPPEVHATKQFNPDDAWNAVVALSRGS